MDEALKILISQAPFVGAFMLFMIYVLRHMREDRTGTETRIKEMHNEALDRHEKSDVVIDKNTQAYGATMAVIDKLEKKLNE